MRSRLIFALALAGLCRAGAASAGPNAGGAMILHANTNLQASTEPTNYCGQSGLADCGAAVTSIPGGDPLHLTAWFALAAFFPESSPRLSGVVFGLSYDEKYVVVSYYDGCGDFELHMQDWPASGSGTAVTWDVAQTGHLTEVYYFVGYGYGADPSFFALAPHPTGGGAFGDDDIPANIDPIALYGALGFNAPGPIPPCPGPPPVFGACCLPNFGGCVEIGPDECALNGGTFQGDGTDCNPEPCETLPVGACCIDTICIVTSEAVCEEAGGSYIGDGAQCEPNPCLPTPVEPSSWGRIKQTYR